VRSGQRAAQAAKQGGAGERADVMEDVRRDPKEASHQPG